MTVAETTSPAQPQAQDHGLVPFLRDNGALLLGPLLWLISTLVYIAADGTTGWEDQALRNGLIYGVGVGGLVAFIGHTFFADRVALSIGWPVKSGFQFEVAMANLGVGVLGTWCQFTDDRGFWLATIVMTSVFLVGAAVGHLRQMIVDHNFAVNNAGFIFYWDFIMPAILIALYVVTA